MWAHVWKLYETRAARCSAPRAASNYVRWRRLALAEWRGALENAGHLEHVRASFCTLPYTFVHTDEEDLVSFFFVRVCVRAGIGNHITFKSSCWLPNAIQFTAARTVNIAMYGMLSSVCVCVCVHAFECVSSSRHSVVSLDFYRTKRAPTCCIPYDRIYLLLWFNRAGSNACLDKYIRLQNINTISCYGRIR